MILTAAAEGHHTIVFAVLLFASAGVFHHSGIKIPYFAFFAHDSGKRSRSTDQHADRDGRRGLPVRRDWHLPGTTLRAAPVRHGEARLDALRHDPRRHDVTAAVLFSARVRVSAEDRALPGELRSTNVDSEWIYRRGGKRLVLVLGHFVGGWYRIGRAAAGRALMQVVDRVGRLHSPATSLLGEPWAISEATLLVAAMLIAFLLLAFF